MQFWKKSVLDIFDLRLEHNISGLNFKINYFLIESNDQQEVFLKTSIDNDVAEFNSQANNDRIDSIFTNPGLNIRKFKGWALN